MASEVGLLLGGGFVVRFVTLIVDEEVLDVELVEGDVGLVVDWVVVVEVDIVSLWGYFVSDVIGFFHSFTDTVKKMDPRLCEVKYHATSVTPYRPSM